MGRCWNRAFMGIVVIAVFFSLHTCAVAKDQERVIPYPKGYVLDQEGASSYQGGADVDGSIYFPQIDFFRLKSNDRGLTILSHYKTYQQSTETTCGSAAALTVLAHYGKNQFQELQLADAMGTLHERNDKGEKGTATSGIVHFFQSIGWHVEDSQKHGDEKGVSFSSPEAFKKFILANLQNNTPIMVENIDWGGHWRVIIGYDTMNTQNTYDDVLIMMDSYDVADHLQDGYVIQPMEKFYYTWFDCDLLPKGQRVQQWLTARP